MSTFAAAVRHLYRAAPAASADADLAFWSARCRVFLERWPDPAARALVAGFEAPSIAFAFAAGYQSALDRLLGSRADGAPRALCVTERAGNRPRQIHASLRRSGAGWVLDGEKSFVTGGTHAAILCVAARLASSAPERPDIRMACVPATRAGITLQPMPPACFVPELPHCAVVLHGVDVADQELLAGDAYELYIRPFRTIEDTQVELALLGQLARRARALQEGPAWFERLLAHAASLSVVAALPAADPAAHVLLAGIRAGLAPLLAELDAAWERQDPAFHSVWRRDRVLLEVAQSVRDQRTARARERLLATEVST